VTLINKFGVFRKINVNPPPILLSQKLLAILFRTRAKGRDFYDVSFLSGKTKPDYSYIKKITDLSEEEFKIKISKHCSSLNFQMLTKDVAPFLFDAEEKNRILSFLESLPTILKP